MEDPQRIEKFRKMALADAQNELAQFSFGVALLESGNPKQARIYFEKTLFLNSQFSKAYQLLGECWALEGVRAEAVATWKKGWTIANQRGDLMPREAMAKKLREFCEEIPQSTADSAAPQNALATKNGNGFCRRCGSDGPRLQKAPLPGALGESILHSTCQACWKEWLAMGIKVVNELRLDLTSYAGSSAYDKNLVEFLRLDV